MDIRYVSGIAAAGLAAAVLAAPASADPVAEFYKDRTVRVLVGTPPGGGYDLYARLFGNHIGKYIPGQPSVIVENMPGAGQMRAARYLYNAAPKDGTVLLAIVQTIAVDTALGSQTGVDAAEYSWIGRLTANVAVGTTWHASGIRSIEDARKREVIFAGTGATDTTVIIPRLLNAYAGTRFRIVPGYGGAAAMSLAMEQGEVEGHVGSWTALKTSRANLLAENKVHILFQMALKRHPDLADIPTIAELGTSDDGRAALQLISSSADVGRSIAGPPGLPAGRLVALRKAFDGMVTDPALIAEVRKRQVDFTTASGQEVESIIAETTATPERIIDLVKAALKQN